MHTFLQRVARLIRRRRAAISVRPGTLRAPGGVVAARVTWCVTHPERLRGVLGRPQLEPDEAYVICRAGQVHTMGVPYALDAIFCDRRWRVLHVETLPPRKASKRIDGSLYVVELLGGRAAELGIVPGQRLSFEDAP
jgi:uncharacterized membrane protein (UPF0127 family)